MQTYSTVDRMGPLTLKGDRMGTHATPVSWMGVQLEPIELILIINLKFLSFWLALSEDFSWLLKLIFPFH